MATLGMIKFTELKFTDTLQKQTDSDWLDICYCSFLI